VFRGPKGTQVPVYFHESAVAAVAAATSIIDMILNDYDVRDGLVGIPHYIHSMIAFACVFLLKVATQHSGQYIEDATVLDLTTKVAHQFRSTAVGKHHLVHLMAEGLEKMATSKIKSPSAISNPHVHDGDGLYSNERLATMPPILNGNGMYGVGMMGGSFDADLSLSATPFLHFETDNYNLNLPGFGF
jgi:hypothetical protein